MIHADTESTAATVKWRAVLFDLDGTLIDTLQDIAASANDVLASHGFAAHPVDAYRNFVGDGLAMLVSRALPADRRDQRLIDQCVGQFGEAWFLMIRCGEPVLTKLRN